MQLLKVSEGFCCCCGESDWLSRVAVSVGAAWQGLAVLPERLGSGSGRFGNLLFGSWFQKKGFVGNFLGSGELWLRGQVCGRNRK